MLIYTVCSKRFKKVGFFRNTIAIITDKVLFVFESDFKSRGANNNMFFLEKFKGLQFLWVEFVF